MGQEVSLPSDPDFDEQARAPPSAANPPPSLGAAAGSSLPSLHRVVTAAASVTAARPLSSKGFFQHGSQADYEARESARAAALGGNLYPIALNEDGGANAIYAEDDVLRSQGSAVSTGAAHETSNNRHAHPKSSAFGTATAAAHSDSSSALNQPVSVGVSFERTGSKRGLFSTPGRSLAHSRGAALIHSMRNLNLGKALGGGRGGNPSSRQQLEWEQQWDEDDESDDEEFAEDNELRDKVDASAAISSELPPSQHDGKQTLKAHHLPAPPAAVSRGSLPSQAPKQPPNLLMSTQAQDLLARPLSDFLVDEGKPNVEMFLPMLRVLGKGSFGKVVLVQKRVGKERGQLFAMKILKKTHLVRRRQIERTRTERKVLSAVNHPFIMKLHYAFQTDDKLYLVLDYCPGGELFFHLSRCRRFPERVARFYAAELLLAIGHLHKRGIIYRDLKPENVLLDADGHVKLGDFGLAKAGISNPIEGAMSMCGTPEYMAPEVLSQQGHGFCVDYWGLGMLTYEMMTGLPPWYTTDRQKLFRRLKSAPLDIPTFFSPAAADCVAALLERNPRRRLGVTGIRSAMEHEFFRNISWRSLYARRVEAPVKPCESWKPPDSSAIACEPDLLSSPSITDMNIAEIEKFDSNELDAATSNFDATFLRMPVESEDTPVEDPEDIAAAEELQDDTFIGFSFDSRERDQEKSMSSPSTPRERTHHYQKC